MLRRQLAQGNNGLTKTCLLYTSEYRNVESWERMKQAVAGRWTGKPGKTGTTVLNPSESRGTVPVKRC